MDHYNDKDLEDIILLGDEGPLYTFVEGPDKEHAGVGIRLTGPMSGYERYQSAAMRLCRQGLLLHNMPDGTPVDYYDFTERGKVAHWAMREAVGRCGS
jgi:hypothetical protein